jgi:hypothetical protein
MNVKTANGKKLIFAIHFLFDIFASSFLVAIFGLDSHRSGRRIISSLPS